MSKLESIQTEPEQRQLVRRESDRSTAKLVHELKRLIAAFADETTTQYKNERITVARLYEENAKLNEHLSYWITRYDKMKALVKRHGIDPAESYD